MLRTLSRVVLLTIAIGCNLDLANKTACESQSDCLHGHICRHGVCTASQAQEDPSAGTTGAAAATGNDESGAAGAASASEGGSAGAEEPGSAVMGGTAGADEGGAGGAAGCEPYVEPAETAEVGYLLHPYPSATHVRFGEAVAVDGDTIVVGTPGDEAVFVYIKTECGYRLQAELSADDGDPGTKFGSAVAIQGDTIVVGAPFAEVTPSAGGENIEAGAVYVFERAAGTWSRAAKLQADNADAGDQFGISVAIDDDTIAMGAAGEDSASRTINAGGDDNSLESDGAAYVFSRAGGAWVETAYVKRVGDSTSAGFNWGFGVSVGLSDGHLVVGSPGTDASGFTDVGSAYSFSEDSGVWTFDQAFWVRSQLTGNEDYAQFGMAVAVSGDFLAVSAPDDGDTGLDYGTVTIYSYAGEGVGWLFTQRLGAFARSTHFGASLAMGPGRLIVGDSLESNDAQGIDAPQSEAGAPGVGAAYLFDRNSTTGQWDFAHYIKASNALQKDAFGDSVAVSGDVFVVSAPNRHTAPEELYSPFDKERLGPGATYVFQIAP